MRPGVLCLRLAWFLLLFLSLLGGCKRSPTIAPAASSERALVPVPAPEGLVTELFVPRPDRTWDAVRASLAGTTPLLPSSAAVFLGGTLGLPVSTLDQLDLLVPMVGALADVQDDVAAVVGIHVKDGARFVELVTSGNPRFTKGDAENGVVMLASPAAYEGVLYAVSGNYLVLSQNAEALRRFAPFVSRTLPGRPVPSEDIVVTASHQALSGPVIGRAKKVWDSWKHDREADDLAMRAKHGGSAPDFGDPAQALADIDAKAARFFTILDDLAEARLAVTVEPKSAAAAPSYRALVSVKPATGSGAAAQEIASMAVAEADPLLSLPAGVAVALLMRDTAEQREQSSSTQVEAISKVLGGRLQPEDKGKVAAAFQSWSKGRGDWLTAGLVWAGPTRAAVIRGAVADPAELGRGISAMLKLLSVRAIADPLSSWVGEMKISGIGAAGDAVVQTVHVVRRATEGAAPSRRKNRAKRRLRHRLVDWQGSFCRGRRTRRQGGARRAGDVEREQDSRARAVRRASGRSTGAARIVRPFGRHGQAERHWPPASGRLCLSSHLRQRLAKPRVVRVRRARRGRSELRELTRVSALIMPRPGYDEVTLLTGFPSFLARRLGAHILEHEPRTLVYAVVRSKFARDAEQTASTWPKAERDRFVMIEGDAGAMDLGLSGAEFRSLAAEVDRIHHAAQVTYLGVDQRTALGLNVEGTSEIIEFARAAASLSASRCTRRPKCRATAPVLFTRTSSRSVNGLLPSSRRRGRARRNWHGPR